MSTRHKRIIQLGIAIGAALWIASCAAFSKLQTEGISFFSSLNKKDSEVTEPSGEKPDIDVQLSETSEETSEETSPVTETAKLSPEEYFQSAIEAWESDRRDEARENFQKAVAALSEKDLPLETYFELGTLYLARLNGNGKQNGNGIEEISIENTTATGAPDYFDTFNIPEDIPSIEAIVEDVMNGDKKGFQAGLNRMAFYEPEIRRLIREEGMPEELIVLPLVESSYEVQTTSRRGAKGLWQFMPSTGHKYNLNNNPEDRPYLDERLDWEKSTQAAMRYLKDLYSLFGSWDLALSGYNWGERNVSEMMLKHYTRDYWRLRGSPGRTFPKETRRYIDKVYAFALIAQDPEKYGFEPGRSPYPKTEKILVKPEYGDLKEIARVCKYEPEVLKVLNAELILGHSPPSRDEYEITVPAGTRVLYEVALAENRLGRRPVSASVHDYTIRRGDTLISIARRYGTSVQAIRDANGLRGHLIIAGKTLKVPVN